MPAKPQLPIRKISLGGQAITLAVDPSQSEHGLTHFDAKRFTFSEACLHDPELFRTTLRHEMQHMALLMGGPAWNMTDEETESVIRCLDELFFPAWEKLNQSNQ